MKQKLKLTTKSDYKNMNIQQLRKFVEQFEARDSQLRGDTHPIVKGMLLGALYPGFIGDKAVPTIETLTQAGTYLIGGDREGLDKHETKRALGSKPNTVSMSNSSAKFACEERALEIELDYAELDIAEAHGAKETLKLKRRAGHIIHYILHLVRELEIAEKVFGYDNYDSGQRITLSGSDQWSDNDSDPEGVIIDAVEAFETQAGISPNTLILGVQVYNTLKQHPALKSFISDNRSKKVRHEDMLEFFDVENILVGKGIYRDNGVVSRIWGKKAALLYLPPEGMQLDIMPYHTVNFEWKKRFDVREVAREDTVALKEYMSYQIQTLSKKFGYLVEGAIA